MAILVVEDEASIRKLLKLTLKEAGYEVVLVEDGERALEWLSDHKPELILLDWMLPKLSGTDLLQSLRAKPSTARVPVLMLTARGSEADRVMGLDFGADDYLTKPFSPKELLARIRAVMRRTGDQGESQVLSVGDIEMIVDQRRVIRAGQEVALGPTEFRLLEHLMRHPGRVFSREALLNQVWGEDIHVEERTVDVHILRLRKRLNEHGSEIIRTVRSMGYAIEK